MDRLGSIIRSDGLVCDETVTRKSLAGTTIGIAEIKDRRRETRLDNHPDLRVGQCVPFYFCPRSVMLYLIERRNHRDLAYLGGQDPIVHLEADMRETVTWADSRDLRWAFTLSNAGSKHFEDRSRLEHLDKVDWNAVSARYWGGEPETRARKQAEFLVEKRFPWNLVRRIGVRTAETAKCVEVAIRGATRRPSVEIKPDWYY